MRKFFQCAVMLFGAGSVAMFAGAQTTNGTATGTTLNAQTATMDRLAADKGQTQVANKTAASFVTLAGSQANALALVNGLRTGTPITLMAPVTGAGATGTATGTPAGTTSGTVPGSTSGTATTTTTGTTIAPPTGKMGWGNVFISLALAQKVLTQAGITTPTTAQLQTALLGGDLVGADGKTVTVKGVLQLRADGMGWGKIAQVYGTKLGPVVSELKSANRQIARASAAADSSPRIKSAETTGTSSTATQTAGSSKTALPVSKGLTTAANSSNASASKGLVSAGGGAPSGKGNGIVTAGSSNGHGNAMGKGVVTAAGGSAASAAGSVAGTRGAGAGLVTATGAAASNASAGLTTAQGNVGQAHGNPNGNGKGKGG